MRIGAGVSLTDSYAALVKHYPQLTDKGALCLRAHPQRRDAGRQRGQRPLIGDTMPGLIVLGAHVRRTAKVRACCRWKTCGLHAEDDAAR